MTIMILMPKNGTSMHAKENLDEAEKLSKYVAALEIEWSLLSGSSSTNSMRLAMDGSSASVNYVRLIVRLTKFSSFTRFVGREQNEQELQNEIGWESCDTWKLWNL